MTIKAKVMAYTVLVYSYKVGFYDTYQYTMTMPTNDTDYSCHIKTVEFFSQS